MGRIRMTLNNYDYDYDYDEMQDIYEDDIGIIAIVLEEEEQEEKPDDIPKYMNLIDLLKFSKILHDEYKEKCRRKRRQVRAEMDEIYEEVEEEMK
jgi:hypothetical protein